MGLITKNPSMMFIHIPKTGGESIREWIYSHMEAEIVVFNRDVTIYGENGMAKHSTQDTLENYLHMKKYNNPIDYKFCVVRNPWARMVSAYEYLRKNVYNKHTGELFSAPFDEFIRREHPFAEGPWGYVTKQQIRYFKDDCIVLKMENLNEDFKIIQQITGIDAPLPHKNKSKDFDYRTYYNDETAAIVEHHCRLDIKTFGYTFD